MLRGDVDAASFLMLFSHWGAAGRPDAPDGKLSAREFLGAVKHQEAAENAAIQSLWHEVCDRCCLGFACPPTRASAADLAQPSPAGAWSVRTIGIQMAFLALYGF